MGVCVCKQNGLLRSVNVLDIWPNRFVQMIRPWPYKIVQVALILLVENRHFCRVNVLRQLTQRVCPDYMIVQFDATGAHQRHTMYDCTYMNMMEDNLWWKTTFDGRRPLMEDDLRWKTTFYGRQPLT